MKVGIDVSSLVYQRGVSRYTSNLVRALNSIKDLDLRLYASSFRQKKFLASEVKRLGVPLSKAVIQSYPPSILEKLWRVGLNPVKKSLPQIEVFHSWDWLQPPDKNLPLVSTIHDLAILKFPETAHPKILEMHKRSWEILKKRKAHLIAVSQSTKQDMMELLDIPASRITVIPESLPEETKLVANSLSEEKQSAIADRLNLKSPYILFVGTREPRKNLMRLIEAWQPLASDFQLIIAGEEGWDETASGKLSHENLRFLGRVSDEELAVLYGEAEVLAFPSLYEGFGLPILEAFFHGTPVVTSNVSSMPEVAGNAAELVDPLKVESITKGLEKVLKEPKEQQKKRLQKMIIRLHMFDWQKVAEETLAVYKKAVEK